MCRPYEESSDRNRLHRHAVRRCHVHGPSVLRMVAFSFDNCLLQIAGLIARSGTVGAKITRHRRSKVAGPR